MSAVDLGSRVDGIGVLMLDVTRQHILPYLGKTASIDRAFWTLLAASAQIREGLRDTLLECQ